MMSNTKLASFALIASCLAACSSSTTLPGTTDDGGNDSSIPTDGSPAPDSATDAPVVTPDAATDAPITTTDAQADVSTPSDSGLDSGHD